MTLPLNTLSLIIHSDLVLWKCWAEVHKSFYRPGAKWIACRRLIGGWVNKSLLFSFSLMWRSRRRMEHANSRSLCKLVSSFHPSLNLFTWNLKRGWITLFEENSSHLLSVHQNNSSVNERVTPGCMLCFWSLLHRWSSLLWSGLRRVGTRLFAPCFQVIWPTSSPCQAVSAVLLSL